MKHPWPTFATIAVLGGFAIRAGEAPVGALFAALAALCLFAALAGLRAKLAIAGSCDAHAERLATIAMLVSSSVVLFCCATVIGWSGHLDLVAVVPVALALLAAIVRDARVQVAPSGPDVTRGVPLVPLCGLLLLTVAWVVDGRLGFDRRLESAHASATPSTRN